MAHLPSDAGTRPRLPDIDGPLIDAPEYLISFLQRLNRDQMESVLRPSGLKLASWRVLSCLEERGSIDRKSVV